MSSRRREDEPARFSSDVRAASLAAAEHLARRMLPPLFERLERSARDLARLSAGRADVLALRPTELAMLDAGDVDCEASGWCLGVLSAAIDANLLVARRDAAGLRVFIERLGVALGRELQPPPSELPELALDRGEGWEVVLLLAAVVLRAAEASREGEPIRWRMEGTRTCFVERARVTPELEALVGLVPGAALCGDRHGALGVELPAGWLRDAELGAPLGRGAR